LEKKVKNLNLFSERINNLEIMDLDHIDLPELEDD
jgi:hypothetical protein